MTLDRDAGEPYYTFQQVHEDFYNRLKTDSRLTREYRIDTWSQGRFDMRNLPPTGCHARYQRLSVAKEGETQCFYHYRIDVVVYVLINHRDVETQYNLSELYLDRIARIFTEQPNDWSLEGTVTNIEFLRCDYGQEWFELARSVVLSSIRFAIHVDIEHLNTQS